MPFILKPCPDGTHSIRPDHSTTIPSIDANKAQAMALIDLGAVDPALAGRKVPFLTYFINEPLRLRQEGSEWVQDTVAGDTLEWAEPFDGGASSFEDITPAAEAELVEVETVDKRAAGVWFQIGGEPRWVQSDDGPSAPHIFVGQMESWYANGTIYMFYNPQTNSIIFECQFS